MKGTIDMKPWPGLLLAPLLVLAEQSIAFSLAPLACARQAGAWLHAVPAAFTLVTLAIALATTLAHRREPVPQAWTLRLAVPMGWFSVVVLLALWLPLWGLDPCRA